MIGNWKWNFFVALASALLTLVLSWPRNPAATSILRAAVAFLILFAAVYAVRWLWGFALRSERDGGEAAAGQAVDLSTPRDGDAALLREMMANPRPDGPGEDEFVPLQPEQLVSRDKLPPDFLARAVRQLSQD